MTDSYPTADWLHAEAYDNIYLSIYLSIYITYAAVSAKLGMTALSGLARVTISNGCSETFLYLPKLARQFL